MSEPKSRKHLLSAISQGNTIILDSINNMIKASNKDKDVTRGVYFRANMTVLQAILSKITEVDRTLERLDIKI